jgi:hypothetical protein
MRHVVDRRSDLLLVGGCARCRARGRFFGAFDTEFGLELRLCYGDDLMRSHPFRGVDHEERCAETADAWCLALLEKGFTEIPL